MLLPSRLLRSLDGLCLFQNICLTKTWRTRQERGPDIKIQPPRETRLLDSYEVVHDTVHDISEEEATNRATYLWYQIIRVSPPASGRVLGLRAAHWMYWAVLVVGVIYCSGYYALLKHVPLI